MITIILLPIFLVLLILLSYSNYNLLKKQEKSEDLIISYMEYLDKLSRVIEISDDKLKKLDTRGIFKSDDEIGFFFEQVKKIQEILNDFKVRKI
jgi:hypothetical protein